MIVFLIGFMGCGKSTLGKKAAAEGGFLFVDTDREAEKSAGKSIAEIFAQEGEEAFRRLEASIVRDICRAHEGSGRNIIVATGGGAPCREESLLLMKRHGTVIYLAASPEVLFRRLREGRRRRPAIACLDDSGLLGFIKAALGEREPYYSRATVKIECGRIGDEEAVRLILRAAAAQGSRE